MDKIIIRPMTPEDWGAVSRIYVEGIATEYATLVPGQFFSYILHERRRIPRRIPVPLLYHKQVRCQNNFCAVRFL